jgi:hypothetical protein
MADILANANDILIDQDGELAYLQDNTMWVYDASDAELLGATVIFNNTDLGVPDVDKVINFVDTDYVGAFTLSFTLDNTLIHTMTFSNQVTRSGAWQDFPLRKRKSFRKLQMTIIAETLGTKIYSLEIDFDVIRRRRYN